MSEQFNQLVGYVRQHLEQGVLEGDIRQILLQHNWSPQLVDQAFSQAKGIPPQPANPESDPAQRAWSQQPTQTVNQSSPKASTGGTTPQKYHVFRALTDTFRAIGHNFSTLILVMIAGYMFAGAAFLLVAFIIGAALLGEFGLLFASNTKVFTVLIGSLVLYTAWYVFAGALIIAMTLWPLSLEAKGEKVRSVQ